MECHAIPKDPASELLSSEDFGRLNETAPRLMRALAEGAGTSVNALCKMAHEGRLTSAVLTGGQCAVTIDSDLAKILATLLAEVSAIRRAIAVNTVVIEA